MDVSRVYKYITIVLMLVLTVAIVVGAVKRNAYESKLIELQNKVAANDITTEIGKGLYEKQTLQLKNVMDALDKKDAQVKELNKQLKASGEKLLTATTATLMWKHAYEGVAATTGSTLPSSYASSDETTHEASSSPADRFRIDFSKDFGYIGVTGYTLTNPTFAFVSVKQNRPLRVTLALSQDKDKVWHTYVTSSEENVDADVTVSAVNPYFSKKSWYENIGFSTALGVGTTDRGAGVLLGFGLDYRLNQFNFGPMVWIGITNTVDKYFGANFTWRPFEKKD